MKKVILFLLLLAPWFGFGQVQKLEIELKRATHDSIRCRILQRYYSETYSLSEKFTLNQKYDSIVNVNLKRKFLTASEKRKFQVFKITALENYGYYYQNSKFREIDRALRYYEKSVQLARKIGDKESIAMAYLNVGFAYEDLGDLPKAIDYYSKAAKIFRAEKQMNQFSITLNNLASVFKSQKKYEQAISYFKECLEIQLKLPKKNEAVVAVIYNNVGHSYNLLRNLDSADFYYNKAFLINKRIHSESGIALIYNNIGENYLQRFKLSNDKEFSKTKFFLDSAKINFIRSLQLYEMQEDWVAKSVVLKNIGMVELNLKQYDKAIALGTESLALAKKTHLPAAIRSGTELLYLAYKEKGDFENAFLMYQEYTKLNDSISNETNRNKITEKGIEYEYDKKEASIQVQHKAEKARNFFIYSSIIVILISTILFSLIYYYYSKKQRENEKVIQETKLALAMIEVERRRISADLHDDLGVGISSIKFLSNRILHADSKDENQQNAQKIVENTQKIHEKLSEIIWELNVEHNHLEDLLLFIQKQGNSIFTESTTQFSMRLPLEIPYIELNGILRKQIYLAVKECFNNVIKHADASIVICDVQFENQLEIQIKDDGRGFNVTEKVNDFFGEGLKNMQNRIESIDGKVHINSNETGTNIQIEIPISQPKST